MKKIVVSSFAIMLSIIAFGQVKLEDRTREQKLNDLYCTGLFKSTDGIILDLENNPAAGAYPNILDWLESRVPGLRVYKTRNNTRVPYIRNQVAGIFVDEQPVTASYLSALPSSEIAMIKVIRTPFLGNAHGNSGAIAIYTFAVEEEEEDVNSLFAYRSGRWKYRKY